MKKIIVLSIILSLFFGLFAISAEAAVRVKGYYRKNGTYVQPHYRSNPDNNPYNNWSYPGNTNPYTGETATGNPDTYLKNYYGNSSPSYQATTPIITTQNLIHKVPPKTDYRIFQVPGDINVYELSWWTGYGTKKLFTSPYSFENHYGKQGWKFIKPIQADDLIKYSLVGNY